MTNGPVQFSNSHLGRRIESQPRRIKRDAKRGLINRRVIHHRDPKGKAVATQDAPQLMTNTLARQRRAKMRVLAQCVPRVRVNASNAKARQKPAIAHHPQRIFLHPLTGITGKAQAAGL